MESKDKKRLILIISGVLFMVAIVAVATYAYFSVPIQNDFSETKIDATIEDLGNVSLLPEVNELALNLSISDMMQQGKNIAYFGTNEGTTTVESTEVIAKASVTGNGVFNCTYDLTMDAKGTKNMYDAVQSMNSKEGNVILTINGVRYDFSETNLFPSTIKGEIKGLTEGVSQDITAQIMLVNRTDITQDELKGTDIEITFKMSNFTCTPIEMGSAGKYILETDATNISTNLVEGLYRFQGTKDEVTNNYFCPYSSCNSSNIHRIVGITPDGQLKIVLANPVLFHEWHTDNDSISWPYSSLYTYLNDSYMSNLSSEQLALIEDKEWKYGDFGYEKLNNLNTSDPETLLFSDIYNVEKDFNNTIKAKVALLNITDVLTHNDCLTGTLASATNCEEGWLYYSSNSSNEHEYALTKIGLYQGRHYIFEIQEGLPVIGYGLTTKYVIRPVFYLNSNLSLTGTGTEADPYTIVA